MKPFRFRLQALLTLRHRAERTALERYAQCLAELQRARDQRDALRTEQTDWAMQWQRCVSSVGLAGTLVQWHACGRNVADRLQQAQAAVVSMQKVCHDALQAMLRARQDREAVEKHIDRQRQEFIREQGKSEQKELDDLAQRCAPVTNDSVGSSSFYD